MVDVVGRHVADGLHDLYEDDAQNHGHGHHVVLVTLVAVADGDIAQAAAVSVPTVIRTLAALRDCELVIVRDNVQPNGARLPNGYELTALGLEVIRMAEELGIFAE